MNKIVISAAVTLDGYMAEGENMELFDCFCEKCTGVVMCFDTYRRIVTELSPLHWLFPEQETYVTCMRRIPDYDRIHFCSGISLEKLTDRLRQEAKGWIRVVGEGYPAHSLSGLGDSYALSLLPVVQGGGRRLFEEKIPPQPLALKECCVREEIVHLLYKKT